MQLTPNQIRGFFQRMEPLHAILAIHTQPHSKPFSGTSGNMWRQLREDLISSIHNPQGAQRHTFTTCLKSELGLSNWTENRFAELCLDNIEKELSNPLNSKIQLSQPSLDVILAFRSHPKVLKIHAFNPAVNPENAKHSACPYNKQQLQRHIEIHGHKPLFNLELLAEKTANTISTKVKARAA